MNSLETKVKNFDLRSYFHNNEYYFSLLDILNNIGRLSSINATIDDTVVVPYYLYNEKIYEIYQYELYIKTDNFIGLEKYIFQETGKTILKDISSEVISNYTECYYEVYNEKQYYNALRMYLQFILVKQELQETIIKLFGSYSENNLFIKIY